MKIKFWKKKQVSDVEKLYELIKATAKECKKDFPEVAVVLLVLAAGMSGGNIRALSDQVVMFSRIELERLQSGRKLVEGMTMQ